MLFIVYLPIDAATPAAFTQLLLHPQYQSVGGSGVVAQGVAATGHNAAGLYSGPRMQWGSYSTDYCETAYHLIEVKYTWKCLPLALQYRQACLIIVLKRLLTINRSFRINRNSV